MLLLMQVVSNRLPVTLHPDRPPPNDVEACLGQRPLRFLSCLKHSLVRMIHILIERAPLVRSSGGLASALRSCVEGYEEFR